MPVALEVTGTVAVYVPASSVPTVGVSVSVTGAVVPLMLAASHPVVWPAP
jgi:hypothetical protein